MKIIFFVFTLDIEDIDLLLRGDAMKYFLEHGEAVVFGTFFAMVEVWGESVHGLRTSVGFLQVG